MKRILLLSALALALAACSGSGPSAPAASNSSLGLTTVISAKVLNWSYGTATGSAGFGYLGSPLVNTTINADGSFTLALPDLSADAPRMHSPDTELHCSGQAGVPQISPSDLGIARMGFGAAFKAISLSQNPGPYDNQTALYVFASTSGSVTGEVQCWRGGVASTLRFNMQLERGWNVVIYTHSGLNDSYVTAPVPAGLQWQVAQNPF